MNDSEPNERHPTALEVARYLDGRSTGADRDRIEAHLADCADCRRDVTNARTMIGRQPRWPRRVMGAAATLVAASVVFVVGAHLRAAREEPTSALVRGGVGDPSPLPVHAPTRAIRAGEVRFIWGPVPGALSYQFTLSHADGTPIWGYGGLDTALVLPDSVVLRPTTRYLWTTDALLPDGSTRSTGVREVDVLP